MIYFLYTSLAHHPYFQGGYRGQEFVVELIKAASGVIAIFTFLFLAYAGAAFTRSRMKEFGLLSLVGLTRGQLVRMIVWENVIIAVAALVLGLGVGLLFLKLFFMIISLLLRMPEALPFYTGWSVWRQTLIVFGTSFGIVSLLSLRGVLRRNIVELVRAGRQPQTNPTFSPWRALLGVLLVGGGYTWASVPQQMLIFAGIVPVTLMVSVGTYFVVREASIALLYWLRRRERFFHRPGPFLTISRLIFKIQENYRVLSAVSILVAVILTAIGTLFAFYVVVEADARAVSPQALQLVFENAPPGVQEEAVAAAQSLLQKHGVNGLTPIHGRFPRATLVVDGGLKELPMQTLYFGTAMKDEFPVIVVPHSIYAQLFRPEGQIVPVAGEQAAVHVHGFAYPEALGTEPQPHHLHVGDASLPLLVSDDHTGRLFNGVVLEWDAVVVTDATFEQLVTDLPDAKYVSVALWTGQAWRGNGMRDAVAELRTMFPVGNAGAGGPGAGDRGAEGGPAIELTTTIEAYEALVSDFGLGLFIGVFVSLVFFAASCSLLYLRLFTELDEDRRYYTRLQQLGVSEGDLRRLAGIQAIVVFFVPFVVGLIHSTFAMQALGTIILRTVLHYGWLVAMAYLALYAVYFAVTFTIYRRALRIETTDPVVVP